jgi:hypothetical protein
MKVVRMFKIYVRDNHKLEIFFIEARNQVDAYIKSKRIHGEKIIKIVEVK